LHQILRDPVLSVRIAKEDIGGRRVIETGFPILKRPVVGNKLKLLIAVYIFKMGQIPILSVNLCNLAEILSNLE